MKYFIRSFSYLFHPLFMPLLGVVLFFVISPRFFNSEFLFSKLFATGIMTIVIPILSFYMLKNLGLVSSIHLPQVSERRLPLVLSCVFTILLLQIVFDGYEIPPLYYYFVGILGATVAALIMAIFKVKVSLHMIAICGLFVFVLGLSLHYGRNLLLLLAILIIAIGGTASSRLEAKAHTPLELVLGAVIGALPQLLVYNYWL